jgi:adenosylcobinamide-GDP ribazoletransferase
MLSVRDTFRFLTLADSAGELDFGRAGLGVLSLPLAGLLLGVVLVIVNRVIEPYLSSEILAVVLVAILVLATGGHFLAGTQTTFDTLPRIRPDIDSPGHWRIYGLLAVLLVVLLKIRSIEVIGDIRGASLLLTPLLARWSLVLFLFGSSAADDDASQRIAENVRSWHVVVSSIIALGVTLFIAGALALWVALFLSLFALLARTYLHRRTGGISLANCGAVVELSEALGFTLFASL